MDAFLTPVNRFQEDYPELFEDFDDDEVSEFELNVPVETLMANSACTWESFSNILLREQLWVSILWTTPNTFVAVAPDEMFHEHFDEQYSIDFDGTFNIFICAGTQEQVSPTLNLIFKLLAQYDEKQTEISLRRQASHGPLPVSVPVLEFFLQRLSCDDLRFHSIALDEAQCQVVATEVREDVHVQFWSCAMADGGATLLQALRTNRFRPRELTIAYGVLFNDLSAFKNALHMNTSLKSLHVETYCRLGRRRRLGRRGRRNEAFISALIEGLAANRGLSELSLHRVVLYDEKWSSLMSSLRHHPALRILRLSSSTASHSIGHARLSGRFSEAEKTARTRQMKEMLEVNTVLSKVDYLPNDECDMAIFENEINPLLEINAHRPMIRAVKEERDAALRACLLARALGMVIDKQRSLTYTLLTENADLVAEHGSKESRLRKRIQDLDHEFTALGEEIARKVQRRQQVTEERESIARELLELP